MDQGPGHDLTGSSTSPLSQRYNQGVSSETGVSRQGSMEKGPMQEGRASRLTPWVLGGSSSSWATGLRASEPLWLLARHCHQLLAMGLSPSQQECKESQRERMNASEGQVPGLAQLNFRIDVPCSCQMLSVRRTFPGGPHSGGRGYTGE